MIIRCGFISNSSSSSFVVVYKVKDMDKLYNYMKEEFGKFGMSLVDRYVWDSDDPKFKLKINDNFSELLIFEDDDGVYVENPTDDDIEKADDIIIQRKFYNDILNTSGTFIFAKRVVWSTEGDVEGDDSFFVDHIQGKDFVEYVMQTDPD